MELCLKDRIFVVNGGTKGLGRDIVIALCREGAGVVFSGRNAGDGKAVQEETGSIGSRAAFIKSDIKKAGDCRDLMEAAEERYGKIDGLVNYAGNNIRANWVTMGWVATPSEMLQFKKAGRDIKWVQDQAKKIMPMGRLQTGEDNVPGVLYLLSQVSSQVTGTELHISGGFSPGKGSQAPRL